MLFNAHGHDRKLPSRFFLREKKEIKISVGVSHNKNIVQSVAYVCKFWLCYF